MLQEQTDAHIIDATQNIYNPYSKTHTSLKHKQPYTVLHAFALNMRRRAIAFLQLHREQISYMLHTTYTIHARKSHLLKTHNLRLSCMFLLLKMRRRAIANFTATPLANLIHATQNIYNPYSKHHLDKTHTHISLYFLAFSFSKT